MHGGPRILPVIVFVLAAGCGGGEDSGSSAAGGAGGAGGAAGASGSGGSAGASTTGCGSTAAPQSGKRTLVVGGVERVFHVHVPAGYDSSKPWPLALNFHGRTASTFGEAAPLQEMVSKLNAKGDAAGFVVVNPQGLSNANDGTQTWNAGSCCADDKSRDDMGFVDAMLDELESALCIDPKRIYSTGLSNGGFMSHRLACERADRIAAIAPVAALNGMLDCTPSRPVSVIAFNGTADPLVSYALAKGSLDKWVTRNGCNATPQETFKNGDSHCDTYSGCQGGSEVVFCTVEDGGHTWPGGADLSSYGFGKTTQDLSANDEAWKLFLAHPLP